MGHQSTDGRASITWHAPPRPEEEKADEYQSLEEALLGETNEPEEESSS
tara:strand:- start:276 stop:422 length:147 start_codon:yes stop_codon:yes gene_type:complete